MSLTLNPACLSTPAALCSVFGSLNLTTVKLSGVGTSFLKHADAESKGIKAHFNMDESGVLLLDRVSPAPSPAPSHLQLHSLLSCSPVASVVPSGVYWVSGQNALIRKAA